MCIALDLRKWEGFGSRLSFSEPGRDLPPVRCWRGKRSQPEGPSVGYNPNIHPL